MKFRLFNSRHTPLSPFIMRVKGIQPVDQSQPWNLFNSEIIVSGAF